MVQCASVADIFLATETHGFARNLDFVSDIFTGLVMYVQSNHRAERSESHSCSFVLIRG